MKVLGQKERQAGPVCAEEETDSPHRTLDVRTIDQFKTDSNGKDSAGARLINDDTDNVLATLGGRATR